MLHLNLLRFKDIEDVVKRVNGRRDYDGGVHFEGWSRMALPVKGFNITTVAKPNIGENKPAKVIAEVCLLNNHFYSNIITRLTILWFPLVDLSETSGKTFASTMWCFLSASHLKLEWEKH